MITKAKYTVDGAPFLVALFETVRETFGADGMKYGVKIDSN